MADTNYTVNKVLAVSLRGSAKQSRAPRDGIASPQTARNDWQRLCLRSTNYGDLHRVQAQVYTQLHWANVEAAHGFADLAREHIAPAELAIERLPSSSTKDLLENLVEQQRPSLGVGNE
jgi:cell division protein FtsL